MIYEPRDSRTIGLTVGKDSARSYTYAVVKVSGRGGETILNVSNNPTDAKRSFANAKYDLSCGVKEGSMRGATLLLKYIRRDGQYVGEIGEKVEIFWQTGTERVLQAVKIKTVDKKMVRENLTHKFSPKKLKKETHDRL